MNQDTWKVNEKIERKNWINLKERSEKKYSEKKIFIEPFVK